MDATLPFDTTNAQGNARASQLKQLSQRSGGLNSPEQARKVAEEFESVFLSAMLAPMFEGDSLQSNLAGSHAERTYKGLLVEQYAEQITKSGGIGIADHVYREMLSLQEVKP